ncbi:hypothetical protein C8F04DRAFT_961680 [Mycena alexandri]|uniref:MYND-type domain-containing protein n=1 Tax=Mycena alexandri TaxID=1745969 RepID=A0AAD6X0N0_9AGAR|nr:hypothetical protein C8F04DRAFT_961680 [Mycena alexandri]
MDGSEPFVTTAEGMAAAIPDRGPLVRACGTCHKTPASMGVQEFSKCASCGMTRYCSRQCQASDWKEHKAICKERVAQVGRLAAQRETARVAGKRFCTPMTIQTWYRNQSAAIEHAAFHILEVYKGPKASLLRTHVAVFTVRVDEKTPEDPDLVRFFNVLALPLDEFAQQMRMDKMNLDRCKKAARTQMMVLYFVDMQDWLHHIEFHGPPSSEPYTRGEKTPDKHWRAHVIMKLNGGLPNAQADPE